MVANNNKDETMGNIFPAAAPDPIPSPNPSPNPISSPECTVADFEVCHFPLDTRTGQHCGLSYEIYGSFAANQQSPVAGTCMTNTKGGFRADWNTQDENYLARKGVRPGSRNEIITYDTIFEPLVPIGLSFIGAYGWLQNPLIEYYVVEDWAGLRPPIGEKAWLGRFESDGGVYDMFISEREEKPSIEGIRTFTQWWSVRRQRRDKGSITMNNHFCAWEQAGLAMGTFYEVSFVAEGSVSVGTADVSLVIETGEAVGCPTTDPTTAPTVGPTSGPTFGPTFGPSGGPTLGPTVGPTEEPSADPSPFPTQLPSEVTTSDSPTSASTMGPTERPAADATPLATQRPSQSPTQQPTEKPTQQPTEKPTQRPTLAPTKRPTLAPTKRPTSRPTAILESTGNAENTRPFPFRNSNRNKRERQNNIFRVQE